MTTTEPVLVRTHSCVFARICVLAAVGVAALTISSSADDAPKPVQVTTRATDGAAVTIPTPGRPTLLLFVRVDQEQSRTAVEGAIAATKDSPGVQTLVILSSQDTPEQIRKLTGPASQPSGSGTPAVGSSPAWPVVIDPEFTLVGQYQVRVWPTSLVIMPDGKEVARLRGLPQTYARDLAAYLAFATGKIDRRALDQALGSAEIVGDSPQQMASRHLQVAQRLLEKGMVEQARIQLEQGLKLHPQDQRLQLTMARALLLLDQPAPAMALLEAYDDKSSLAGEVGTLKGWALVEQRKWDQAIVMLRGAVRLNPNPAEAYYFLGIACQVKGQPVEAAAAFRSAYEATLSGRLLAVPEPPAAATQPAQK
jgi:hypothetical protein